jgi:hypothetical protein
MKSQTIDWIGLCLFFIRFSGTLFSYLTPRPITRNANQAAPTAPEPIAAFLAFLHNHVGRMPGL